MIDALASEPHFLDHLAPVCVGVDLAELVVPPGFGLVERAESYGLNATMRATRRTRGRHPVLVASYGDMRRAAGNPIILMEHGSGQTYSIRQRSYAGGPSRHHVRLFLCPNEAVARANRRHYPATPAVVVGTPRLDRWHTGGDTAAKARTSRSRPTVAISFHWDCAVVEETRSAFAHYRPALTTLAEANRTGDIEILGHGHPRIYQLLRPLWIELGIEPVETFDEVLARADCYAVDNSSTLFEFASTGRPVVVMNAPWYRRAVSHGLRFWDAADVGVQVDEPDRLLDAIHTALADPPEVADRRAEIIDVVYPVRDGTATARAVAAIEEHLPMSIINVEPLRKVTMAPRSRDRSLGRWQDPATGRVFKMGTDAARRRGYRPAPPRHKKQDPPASPAPAPAGPVDHPAPEPPDDNLDDEHQADTDMPTTVRGILEWVGDDPDRRTEALIAEQIRSKGPRPSLIEALGGAMSDGS